jgi:hypothetical protein
MWCVLLLLAGSFGKPAATPVDKIELNHTPNYTQVILWQWSHDYQRYDAVGWWMADRLELHPTQHGQRWTATNSSGKVFTSRVFGESWTRNDPERINARFFPEGMRCCR